VSLHIEAIPSLVSPVPSVSPDESVSPEAPDESVSSGESAQYKFKSRKSAVSSAEKNKTCKLS